MDKLIRSLEKGNVQMVTMQVSGKDEKVFLKPTRNTKPLPCTTTNFSAWTRQQRQERLINLN